MMVNNFFQKLIKVKFRFKRIDKCQVIIFGSTQANEIFKSVLKEISFSTLPLVNFEINLSILLNCLFHLKFNKYFYYSK